MSLPATNPLTLPVKPAKTSSLSVPAAPASKATFASDAAPNSSVAPPLIVALPPPPDEPRITSHEPRNVAGIIQRAVHHQTAAAARFQQAGVGDDIAAGVDDERVAAVGEYDPRVDERHLSFAELAGGLTPAFPF